MNINTTVGLVLGFLVMFVTASMGGQGLRGFLDIHAFLIVFGGCTSAVIIAVDLSPAKADLAFAGATALLLAGARLLDLPRLLAGLLVGRA